MRGVLEDLASSPAVFENQALASNQGPVFCVRALGQRRPRFPCMGFVKEAFH